MTRWPQRRRDAAEEPPAWVRTFTLDDWRAPDKLERRMAEGCGGSLSAEAARWHAERRWVETVNQWYAAHPAAAAVMLAEFLASLRRQEVWAGDHPDRADPGY